ncbi:hypothetical protein EVAR_76960_1 [Eumeta japonica]|uniref:Uncharacterized protein n=1 Tax=Eumeta variegata TaxID=151549 RepID=A0A4C1SEX0_EUMVA|nr:hypothetical protein EVAR_76960_1 [Eumeta japonica]
MSLGLFGGSLSFDHHSHDWEAFKCAHQFCVANGVTDENDKISGVARFSHYGAHRRHNASGVSLVAPDSLDAVPYERLVSLRCPFYDQAERVAERYNFYRAEQRSGKDVAEWAARVRTLARYCNFQSELDIMLRDRFILGLQDVRERERLFTEDAGKITFVAAMELVQSVQCARAAARRAPAGDSGGASSVGGVFASKKAISRGGAAAVSTPGRSPRSSRPDDRARQTEIETTTTRGADRADERQSAEDCGEAEYIKKRLQYDIIIAARR